ncbi:LPS export ABC transporter permease LptG [Lysobacter rhizosphaerae]
MKPFPRIHDLYVGRVVFTTILLVWAVLIGLDLMLGFVGEFSDIGRGNYEMTTAIAYMAYTVPRRLYELFPYAAVVGSLMALGQLAASSELTALRALGLSRRRLSVAVAGALAVLTLLMVFSGETAGPWGERRSNALKTTAKSKDMIVARYSGLWAREGDVILNANGGEERDNGTDRWLELRDVRLYEFAGDGRLKSLALVKVAEHRPGGWLLRDVTRTNFQAKSVTQTKVPEERWASKLDAVALTAGTDKPRYLAAGELRKAIAYRQRNDLDASEFEAIYWGRWFYPLNILALCLAAVPFAFGTLRSGGMGKRLFIGIVFSLGFWLLQQQCVRLAQVYHFDYRIAYLLPTLVMLTVSFFFFRRRSG